MLTRFYSIIFTIILLKTFEVASLHRTLKNWESYCAILSCQPVLNQCVQDGCLGISNCTNCVKTSDQNCVRCVDSIINEQLYTINGNPTILCDTTNSIHQAACGFYCRTKEETNWTCEIIEGYPLCNCNEKILATSTVSSTSAIPLGSLLSNTLFHFYFFYLNHSSIY
jgi:hypothetical protein